MPYTWVTRFINRHATHHEVTSLVLLYPTFVRNKIVTAVCILRGQLDPFWNNFHCIPNIHNNYLRNIPSAASILNVWIINSGLFYPKYQKFHSKGSVLVFPSLSENFENAIRAHGLNKRRYAIYDFAQILLAGCKNCPCFSRSIKQTVIGGYIKRIRWVCLSP